MSVEMESELAEGSTGDSIHIRLLPLNAYFSKYLVKFRIIY
jgi:hypothetical protein